MFIYGYAHPLTNEIFYIGKTNDMEKRNYAHMRYSKGKNKDFSFFLSQLRRKKLEPLHVVLEVCSEEIVLEREKFWIDFGLERNWPLTNKCFGGINRKKGARACIDYRKWLNEKLWGI